jgi:DNA-binding phage protein
VADEHAGALAALAKQVQKIAKAVGLSRARIYQIIAAASA